MGNELFIMVFAALACTAGGLASVVAAGEWDEFALAPLVRAGEAAAALLAAGLLALVFSLGRPELFFGMLGNTASAFFPVVVLSGISLLSLVAFCAAHYRGAEAASTRSLALLSGAAALLLALAAGKSLMMPWQPALNTWTIPTAFLGWAVSAADIAESAFAPATRQKKLATWAVGIASLGVLAYLTVILANDGLLEDDTALRPFTGDLAPLFWIGVVAVGIALPFLLARRFGMGESGASGKLLCARLVCVTIGAGAFHAMVYQLGMPAWHFFG